jgi:very-short-patch-repair endonuclease
MQIKAWGLPTPDREFLFHPERRWRADFAWPDFRLLVEVEGITPGGGRHQRMLGFEADATKYAEAQALGWTVLRLTPTMVRTGYGIRAVQAALERARWAPR